MKLLTISTIAGIAALALASCAYWPQIQTLESQFAAFVTNPTNAALEKSIVSGIASIVAQAKTSTPAVAAYNDASTIATMYQAYVGSGSAPASVIAAGTQISAVGKAAASALSAAPASQAVANGLFQIASDLAPVTTGT